MSSILKDARSLIGGWSSLSEEEKILTLESLIDQCVDASPLERNAIRNQLKQHKVCSKKIFNEQLEVCEEKRNNSHSTTIPSLVHVSLAGLAPPCAGDLKIPPSWHVSAQGIYKEKEDGRERIAPHPVIVVSRSKEVSGGGELLELACHRNGTWQHFTTKREIVMDARKNIMLASWGFPISSTNARSMVEYLAASETQNLPRLPTKLISNKLGWLRDGEGFLLGREFIRSPGSNTHVEFHPPDAGDRQVAAGFHTSGTKDGWLKAIKKVHNYPRVLAVLYGSLAPPILKIIKAPNPIIDVCYYTSSGKTICMRVGGSVWGNPDERSQESVIYSWDFTLNWFDRVCAVQNDLPLLLDDTKRCRRKEYISQVLYCAANGRGRGRASLTGTQETGAWTTATISTGESAATHYGQDGGGYARTMTLWGPPWDKTAEETGKLVNKIDAGVKANYGWAGREFVEYLVYCKQFWDDWRREYRLIRSKYQQRAGSNSVAHRIADHFATLQMTAKLAHEAMALPWTYENACDAVDSLWKDVTYESTGADIARTALDMVVSWAEANSGQFYGRQDKKSPPESWAGRWDTGDEWGFIAFYPHVLKDLLHELGYREYEAIRRNWLERGWLDTDPDRQYVKRMRCAGGNPRLVVLKRTSTENTVSLDPDDFAE